MASTKRTSGGSAVSCWSGAETVRRMAEKMEGQCRLWQVHFQLRDRQRSAIWHDECNPPSVGNLSIMH